MGLVEQVKSLVSKTSKAAKKASPSAAKTCKVKLADAKKKTKEAETIAKKAIKVAKDAMKDLEKEKKRTSKIVVVKLRGKGKKTRRGGNGEQGVAEKAAYRKATTPKVAPTDPKPYSDKPVTNTSSAPDPPTKPPVKTSDEVTNEGGRRRRY